MAPTSRKDWTLIRPLLKKHIQNYVRKCQTTQESQDCSCIPPHNILVGKTRGKIFHPTTTQPPPPEKPLAASQTEPCKRLSFQPPLAVFADRSSMQRLRCCIFLASTSSSTHRMGPHVVDFLRIRLEETNSGRPLRWWVDFRFSCFLLQKNPKRKVTH